MWWVPYKSRKGDIIISKVKARIRKTSHKYGIEIPTSVKDANDIDIRNNNNFWRDAILKEMMEVRIDVKVLEYGKVVPIS